jgi:ABC-type antimicrobial peptide transport system permease subunit
MAYTVTQRRQEIGVRVALGATAADVLRLVVTEGLSITGAGVAIGLLLAAGLSRLMTTMLFQVSAIDPAIYSLVAVVLTIVAGCACGWPAFRATRVDPVRALRCE